MLFILNPKNWPIMIKISAALLGAFLIPAVLIAYSGYSFSVSLIQNTEYENIKLLAAATGSRLDQLMRDNVIAATQLGVDSETIRLIADPDGAPEALRTSVSDSLIRFLATNPQYEYVYILDKTGKVVLSRQLADLKTVEGSNFKDRAYFLAAMEGKTYIDVLVGRTSNRLGFYFSAPILQNGTPIGAAVIKLQGEAITSIINQSQSGENRSAFLVDQDGVIVTYQGKNWDFQSLVPLSRETEIKVGQRFNLPGCQDAAKLDDCKVKSLNFPGLQSIIDATEADRNTTYTRPTDGSVRIVGIANTSQLNWSVGVDESQAEFTRPLSLLALETFLIVVVVGVVVVIAGFILARLITNPLGKLSLAAQAIENGETPDPSILASVVQQTDEVGQLAQVFSNMIQALHARVSELHTINLVSRTISSSFNIGNTLTLVLNSLRNVVPYDRALVLLYDPKKDEFSTRATADGRGFYLNRVWSQDDHLVVHKRDENHIEQFFANREVSPGRIRNANQRFLVLIPDLTQVPDTELQYAREWPGFEPRSYLGVPLLFKDEIIGLIELASLKPGAFNADHERVLELIAGQAAVAVRNALDVEVRESELRRQIDELQIVIDEGKKQKSVNEIVESDFFQELTSKANQIRQKRKGPSKSILE